MRLCVCENLGNNKTRLEYTSSRVTPYNPPRYVINSDVADEFVYKYNKKSSDLAKLSAGLTTAGALSGLITSAKKNSVRAVAKTFTGAAAGFLTASFISYKSKDELMNKYKVDKYI